MKRLISLCFLTLIAAGCAPTGSCRLTIAFPDDDARSLVSVLEIWVVAGSNEDCGAMIQGSSAPGDPGLEVLAHLRLAYPPPAPSGTLDDVPLGSAAFFIEGRGQAEEIFLRGCSTAKVSSTGTVERCVLNSAGSANRWTRSARTLSTTTATVIPMRAASSARRTRTATI